MSRRADRGSSASRGLWIALYGLDGAGKSTIAQRLMEHLEPVFSEIALFHFRPMFRHHPESRSPTTAPHAQAPRNLLVSACKLVYWLIDCWYGYLITIRPRRLRSGLIIFDRYVDDVLVDPVRYRLPLSSLRFAELLVRLAPRPDLCILLDVPADIAQQRKPEVSCAESQRQRAAYRARFRGRPEKLQVRADEAVDEVTRRVSRAVLAFLADAPAEWPEVSLIA